MKWSKDYVWPIIGLAAVAFSGWLLYHQLSGISLEDILGSLYAIPWHGWLLAALSTLLAYAALAGYDWLALLHLRKKNISWSFITAASFTAYAIGHNLGASVVSGGVVRYRAYKSQGLTTADVGILVAFCSFTFSIGAIMLGGIVLLISPDILLRFSPDLSRWVAWSIGLAMLVAVGLYVVGAKLRFRAIRTRNVRLQYPRIPVVWRQLLIAPLELIGAAAIIYFALPGPVDPGFLLVLGVFLASFSAALVSHAPGGLGVLELAFLIGLPEVDPADMIAALLVFRLFYLLIPFAISIAMVVWFEHDQWLKRWRERRNGAAG